MPPLNQYHFHDTISGKIEEGMDEVGHLVIDWTESHLKNIQDHFVRRVRRGLRRVVEDRLEEVVVEMRRHDRRRILFAVQQKKQLEKLKSRIDSTSSQRCCFIS